MAPSHRISAEETYPRTPIASIATMTSGYAFETKAYPDVIVAILVIGVLGYVSSALVRWLGARQLPWLQSETV